MRDPAALAPRPAGTQAPADPALTRTTRSRECPQPARRPEQPGQRNRPAASRRSTTPAITPTVTIGASVHLARPSRHLGQEKDGRAAAYPNLITVASHTKKGNPTGLPSRPSSPQTTKLFQPITMLRLSRYATAKSAVVYGLQGRRVSAFACSAGPPWGDGGPTPPRRLAPSGSAIAKSEASVVPSGGSVQIHQVGHPRIVGARQVDGRNVPIGQRRAGRLLTASLLLPSQARQGSW